MGTPFFPCVLHAPRYRRNSPRLDASATGGPIRAQAAGAGDFGQQIFHLVGEDVAVDQNEIFSA